MKINELVEKYQKNARINIAQTIEAQPYIGIELKRHLASLVLDNCTTIIDGEIHIDSIEKYLLFTLAVISAHTNLEFSSEDDTDHSAIDDYDTLCETGLLSKVIETFKDDYAACQEVLNMMTSDRLQNNMTLEKKLGNLLDNIQELIGDSLRHLVGNLDIDELMSDASLDQNKIINLFNTLK